MAAISLQCDRAAGYQIELLELFHGPLPIEQIGAG